MRRFTAAAVLVAPVLAMGCSGSGESRPAEGDTRKQRSFGTRSGEPSSGKPGADPLAPDPGPSPPAGSSSVHDVTPILSVCPAHGNTASDICPVCKQAVSPR